MRIKPFDMKYLIDFKYDGIEAPYLTEQQVRENVFEYSKQGPVWVGVRDDGKVLAFAGMLELFPGVGYCWAYFNRSSYPFMVKMIKKMRSVIKNSGYRRVQSFCIDNDVARRFLKSIGFVEEGVMRNFLPCGDMIMCSIIKGEI